MGFLRALPTLLACLRIPSRSFAVEPRLLACTYLGGTKADAITDLRIDTDGQVWVSGVTASPNFPVQPNVTIPENQSITFILKLSPDLKSVGWSKFFPYDTIGVPAFGSDGFAYRPRTSSNGGMHVERLSLETGEVVASRAVPSGTMRFTIDREGGVYLIGSAGPDLAATPGAYQPRWAGGACMGNRGREYPCPDIFVTKLSPSLAVSFTTFLGWNNEDRPSGVVVDPEGSIWVTGDTQCGNFPTTPNALQRVFRGVITLGPTWFGDAFVARLDSTGRRLLYATLLGGDGADVPLVLGTDASGNVYAGGATQSADFPTSLGAYQRSYGGPRGGPPGASGDGFLPSFRSDGTLRFSTYIGGAGYESVRRLAVDAEGNAYTNAVPSQAPITGSRQPRCGPAQPDMSRLDPSGSKLELYSGRSGDRMVLDGAGRLYSAGSTNRTILFAMPHSLQSRYGGHESDGFVAIADPNLPPVPELTCIGNAASLLHGYTDFWSWGHVAPGEIVTLFGRRLQSQASPRIQFDGIPAPILYAGDGQINAVAPFGITGPYTNLTVQFDDVTVGPYELPVNPTVPGVFTADGSGSGQGAILNEDGSLNSVGNPAEAGSVVAVYATGAGRMRPAQTDGEIAGMDLPLPAPELGISVSIGGQPADVLYAGAAPGLIAGAIQVNARIPAGLRPGSTPLLVHIGNFQSQFGVTVAAK